jgi:hypothetical protein
MLGIKRKVIAGILSLLPILLVGLAFILRYLRKWMTERQDIEILKGFM